MIRIIGIENDWKDEWIGKDSEEGTVVTTNELQYAIHHWLEDIPVREHTMSTGDLQEIIAVVIRIKKMKEKHGDILKSLIDI